MAAFDAAPERSDPPASAMGRTVIPLIDARVGGAAALAEAGSEGAARLIASGKRMMTPPVVALFDRRSERWARRTGNPYTDEISRIADRLPRGVWFMNFCYEWGCTTGVADHPDGGVTMRRTLDWPFHGLGREVVVARLSGPAGGYFNITWPGFVGVITGMAPGRFALAINQAPLRRRGPWPHPIDWTIDRFVVERSAALPPAHLARQVLEECPDFDTAARRLMETEIALPAFFTLSGVERGQGCVIEHLGAHAVRHDGPEAVANDWLSEGRRGKPRGKANSERRALMKQHGERLETSRMDWVIPPILNKDTRLAAVMNAASGALSVMGFERDGPATDLFDLAEPRSTVAGGAA
jgi:hypothetical protein